MINMSENQTNHKHMPETVTEKITWPAILITSVGLAVFLLVVVIVSIFAVEGLVTSAKNARLGPSGSRELNALHAEDQKILGEYRALENGNYRIPIDLAMELTVKGAKIQPAAAQTDTTQMDTSSNQMEAVSNDSKEAATNHGAGH